MTRIIEREKVIKLRKQGKTYNEIKVLLGIPKSTLSGWLKDLPLSKRQIRVLEKRIKWKRLLAVEKTSRTKYRKRLLRLVPSGEVHLCWSRDNLLVGGFLSHRGNTQGNACG